MRLRFERLMIMAVVGVLLGTTAFAQMTQGRLIGTVADAQGAVMPGVTVTATSPALIGAQSTVTEANGKYLFPSLPSGTYRLTFDLSGFQKVNRENINVGSGQTISADVQLQVASLAESVTVTGASPVVDVTTTKVGTNLKGEALTAVPNSTDAWGALSEAPGVRMQGFDVGGSHKSQQSGYEVFGIQNQSRIGTCEYARAYRTPAAASRSSVGVNPAALPYAPSRSRRSVSIVTSSTLAPRNAPLVNAGGAGPVEQAAPAEAAAMAREMSARVIRLTLS